MTDASKTFMRVFLAHENSDLLQIVREEIDNYTPLSSTLNMAHNKLVSKV